MREGEVWEVEQKYGGEVRTNKGKSRKAIEGRGRIGNEEGSRGSEGYEGRGRSERRETRGSKRKWGKGIKRNEREVRKMRWE